jgi:hypothetical protein
VARPLRPIRGKCRVTLRASPGAAREIGVIMPPQALSSVRPVSSLRALRQSRDGSVATTFALVLLPALFVVGAGIDVTRAYTARVKFDAAFDSAASALRASAATDSAAVLRARMQGYLDLANPSSAQGSHVTVRMSDPLQPVVMMTASAAVPTSPMRMPRKFLRDDRGASPSNLRSWRRISSSSYSPSSSWG